MVEREKYGVVSAFLNLVRNDGNVAGIAIATAMAAWGYQPSLEAVQSGDPDGAGIAFTARLENAYLATAGLIFLAMVLSAFKFSAIDVPEPVAETVPGNRTTPRLDGFEGKTGQEQQLACRHTPSYNPLKRLAAALWHSGQRAMTPSNRCNSGAAIDPGITGKTILINGHTYLVRGGNHLP